MTRRVNGKGLVPIVVVALLATVGTLIYRFFEEQALDEQPIARVALPDGELWLQPGHAQRGWFFLTRRIAGEEVWREGLYGVQEGTGPVVLGELIVIRAKRSSGLAETHAFHLADGSFAWSGGTPGPPLHTTGAPGPTFAHEQVIVEVYEGSPGQLIGLDASDGKTLFSLVTPVPTGSTLDGGVIRIPTDPPACHSATSGEAVDCPQ